MKAGECKLQIIAIHDNDLSLCNWDHKIHEALLYYLHSNLITEMIDFEWIEW